MARVLLVGVVALFAVFAAVWFLADTAPAVPSGAGPADPDAVEAPAAVEATAALDAPVAIEREAAPEPEAAATNADAGPRSTLRGRCLDADGNPIAGVAAGLTGWGGNSQRVEAWLRDHPEPERLSEEQTTGADGVFEFRFWPPPPFQFFVRLQAPGRATWSQRWNEIPIGSDVDAGDVTLPAGALLRGRVIDADGAPVAKVEIRINASGDRRASRDGGYDTWCTARTRDDGTFASRWALLAGDYDLAIDGHPIEAPKQVTLSGEDLFVDVVLQRIEPGDTITGVVVDESGAPIRGAMVHATGVNTGRINSTDCDGHFRVLRQENSPDEIRISAVHSSYSAADPGVGEAVRWGRDDVRIVLQKGGGVSILAVRADDGTPVEDYVLRILPLGGGFFSSGDARPRGGDHHDKGRENVEGLRPGRHQAFVQPRAGDLAIGSAVLEVTSAGGSPVVVRLAGTSPRQVLVQRADGTPVAGSKVQLADPLGSALTPEVTILGLDQWGFTTANKAFELAACETDAAGEAELPVPADRPLGVAVTGPTHTPLRVPNATFPLVGPLVLTVQSGATLRGTIGPPAALAELRRLAGIEAGAEPTAMQWPNVCVVRDRSLSPRRFPEFRSPCGLRPDGSFELGGIPPGTWHLTVNCMKRDPNGRGGHWLEEPAGEFTLADGAITTVEVDFSRIVPGEFEGLVLHNGAPLVNTIVGVQTKLDDPTGEFTTFHEQVTTDAEGRFHATVRGGDYTLRWNRSRGERWSALQAPERAVVVAGQRTQQTFHLESGAVKLRLLDAAGSPVVGVAIELRDAAGGSRPGLPPTDADGRTEGEFDAVPMTASVLPRRLLDREALTAFYQAHRGERDPTASVRLVVGNLTPQLGQTVELELRVPAEFDR